MVENELGRFPRFMENVAPSDSHGDNSIQSISKKRARFEMSPQTPLLAERAAEPTKQNEVFALKEALKSERGTLCMLYKELEEERGASMTAANEAMAMITRLQEEKASVLMEARLYKRVAEEKEAHNHVAISLLKDALMTKEDDLLALQDLLNAYRETVFRLESEHGRHQCKYLEADCQKQDLLYLEGPKSCLGKGMFSNSAKHIGQETTQIWRADNSRDEVEYQHEFPDTDQNEWLTQNINLEGPSVYFGGVFDKESVEGASEERTKDTRSVWQRYQDNRQGNDSINEVENDKHLWGQRLEDVSASIFARVKRLEERFEYLRQNQSLDNQTYSMFNEAGAVDSNDLVPEDLSRPNSHSSPKLFSNRNTCSSVELGRGTVDYIDDSCGEIEPEEVMKCLSFERVKSDFVSEDDRRKSSEYDGGACYKQRQDRRAVDEKVSPFHDDEPERVLDVYEIQIETKRPVIPPPPEGDLGVPPVLGNQAEVCRALIDDKLSLEISSLDVKGSICTTNVADDDVQQLKVRLQALEDERAFMKDAIESLRKENKQLRVLQELAQQLRDLKGDVRKTRHLESSTQHNHPTLFSFFKGIMTFNGSQSSSPGAGSRSLLRMRSSPGTQEQGGLLHILNKTEKSVCVTRERKVNLSNP